jgi:hypothetical protein
MYAKTPLVKYGVRHVLFNVQYIVSSILTSTLLVRRHRRKLTLSPAHYHFVLKDLIFDIIKVSWFFIVFPLLKKNTVLVISDTLNGSVVPYDRTCLKHARLGNVFKILNNSLKTLIFSSTDEE